MSWAGERTARHGEGCLRPQPDTGARLSFFTHDLYKGFISTIAVTFREGLGGGQRGVSF